MIDSSEIAFFRFATPSGFPRGVGGGVAGGDEVQKVFVQESEQEKII